MKSTEAAMKSTEAVKIRRPPKELRDQMRRNQIVAAARTCMVRHGFHAASMAEIATEARMSVGQIYRYFPSKEAIVHVIVERIVDQRLQSIDPTVPKEELPEVLATRLVAGMEDLTRDDRILMLEVSAEATRNEAVAKIARDADRRMRTRAIKTLGEQFPGISETVAAATFDFLAALSEGTAQRRVSGLRCDEHALTELYQRVFRGLLLG
jgi:AcrR family transcriptional regulator